jgi:hypothetical protein
MVRFAIERTEPRSDNPKQSARRGAPRKHHRQRAAVTVLLRFLEVLKKMIS